MPLYNSGRAQISPQGLTSLPVQMPCDTMSTNEEVLDLNLDFSDRNHEIYTQKLRRSLVYDIHFNDTDSEATETPDEMSPFDDELACEDGFIFDHRIEFNEGLPPHVIVNSVKDGKMVAEDPEIVVNIDGLCVDEENDEYIFDHRIEFSEDIPVTVNSCNCVNPESVATDTKLPVAKSEDKSSNTPTVAETNKGCLPDVDEIQTDGEKNLSEARRNDREEIRKKLAMGVDDDTCDDDTEDGDGDGAADVYQKPTLHSRMQGGMNLQICFMNESPCDIGADGRSPRQPGDPDNVTATALAKVAGIVDSDNNIPSMADLNPLNLLSGRVDEAATNSKLKATAESRDINFQSKQELLQNEAKLALAQAGSMARMQLEIEKQLQTKSPMAEMVGIPGLGDRRRKKLGVRTLQEMNLAQIQVLYNDLQTQIEDLNEDLVKLLMERDELHMEQDSMLVDIEDLTRRAEELAEKANSTPTKSGTPRKGHSGLKGRILGR